MGMEALVEGIVWQPNILLYIFLLICILLPFVVSPSVFTCSWASSPYSRHNCGNGSKSKSPSTFDMSGFESLRFHRKFLLVFSLASVVESMWSLFGEFDFAFFNVGKEEMLASMCLEYSISLLCGALLGCLFDFIGHRKGCFAFFVIHVFIGMCNRTTTYPYKWFAKALITFASSIFSCSFESWLVIEHKQLCYRKETLPETLWLMTFIESVMLCCSQAFANKIVGANLELGITFYSTVSMLLVLVCIIYLGKEEKESSSMRDSRVFRVSYMHLFHDQRVFLLGFSHSCLHFSIVVFWVLWAPTLLADGRAVNLGMIFPLLMGSRMVGTSVFQLLLNSSSQRTEESLVYAFAALGIVFSLIASDYQEVGVLVSLFCLFHVGEGFIAPSLARLRAIHVPNEIRGGMIGLSIAPANAMMLFLLIQRGYYGSVENSTMIAIAAASMFIGCCCVYCLRRGGKLLYQNGHKL